MPLSNSAPMEIPRPELAELSAQARWIGLLFVAVGLHVFEAALPSLGPWFKPGLANLVSLIALGTLGARAAVSLSIGRVVIGAFFIGTLLTPTFIISLSAGLAAALIMVAAWRLIPGISLIGVSLLAAVTHMTVQFVTVEMLFIRHEALFYMLPPMLLLATITGWINGAIAHQVVRRLQADAAGGVAGCA